MLDAVTDEKRAERMQTGTKLVAVKWLHTIVWAIFASSILAIPVCVYLQRMSLAWWLIGFVFLEVLVLFFNKMRCPLTDVASRYTSDHRDGFDIYLPPWLARNNKRIFGTLYVVAVLYALTPYLAH